MQIFCETGNQYYQSCFKISKNEKTYSSQHFELSIEDILAKETKKNIKFGLFLNEDKFKIYHFDMIINEQNKITIQTLKKYVNDKLLEIYKQHGQNNHFLYYTIDSIFVNGKNKKYIIGESGQIFFKLSFFFLKPEIQQIYQIKFPNIFSSVDIYPSTFFTVRFIKENLQKKSFFLLYIEDNMSKLIHIQNGFYRTIETVNIGINMLKETYTDNNISDLFYANTEQLEGHPLVKDIVYQSVDFFTQMLAKRLRQYIDQENDLILVSPITKNIFFQKQFNKWYNHFINGFILPFSYSSTLDTFGKKREAQEINILTFLNSQKDLQKIIWK